MLASFIPQQQNKHKVQLQQLFLRRTFPAHTFFFWFLPGLVHFRSEFLVCKTASLHLTPSTPPSPPCYNDRSAVAVQQRQQRLSMEECSSGGHSRAFVEWNVSVWKKTCVYDGAIVCESQNHRGERVSARVRMRSSF